jgi:hypothetical protein
MNLMHSYEVCREEIHTEELLRVGMKNSYSRERVHSFMHGVVQL